MNNLTFRKSSYSGPQGCVQARLSQQHKVELGDTTEPQGFTFLVPKAEWTRFLTNLGGVES